MSTHICSAWYDFLGRNHYCGIAYTCFGALHDVQNTVAMPTRHIFAVLGMAFPVKSIIDRWSTLALVWSRTSTKRYPCTVDRNLPCLVWFSYLKSLLTDGLHLLWYGPRLPRNDTHRHSTHLCSAPYGVLTAIYERRMVSICLGMLHDVQKTVPIPYGNIFALLGVVFSPKFNNDGWSTLALVSSTTSKTQYPCPVDTCLHCLVWFFSPQTIIDGWSTLALVCSTTSRKLYPCHGQISRVLGMLFSPEVINHE